MTAAANDAKQGRAVWGWRILTVFGILLIIDGAWLFFAIGGGSVFQGDTGVPMAEVRQAYPTVVDVMNRRGDLIGLLAVGIGAVALTAGLGARTRDAWNAAATVGATSLAVAAYLFAAGNVAVGVAWLGFAFLAGVGLALARPRAQRS